MKKLLSLLAVCIGLFSCQTENTQVKRISNLDYETIVDTIISQMPGAVFYQNGLVYWHDVLSPECFIHVVDVVAGRELNCFGRIGNGPEECTNPLISLSPEGGLFINDVNKSLELLYRIDHSTDSIHVSKTVCKNNPRVTRMLHLKGDKKLYFCPDEKEMFLTVAGEKEYRNGVSPIEDEISNGYDIIQGNIACSLDESKLVYSAMRIPYLAVYHWTNEGWCMEKELKSPFGYTIADSKLRLTEKNVRGTMELALTEDYIVLLQRDEQVEGEPSAPKYPRDMSVLPRSLFVYDYQLDLKAIINMSFPLLRICSGSENELYAIAANPDFSLIRIKLPL